MTPDAIEQSTILVCNDRGTILRVMCDGLGLTHDLDPGQTLVRLVDPESFKEALSFLVTLKERGSASGWELNAPLAGQTTSLYFAGAAIDANLIVCISKDGAGARERFASIKAQTAQDSAFYDEISRLNNDLINLQRELAQKNVELEGLNERLERDNRALKQAEVEIRQQRNQLRGLSNRVAEVQEIERQHLAQELHDQVCQNLASIALSLETFKLRAQQEPLSQLLNRLSDVSSLVEQTGEITSDIMEGLRPTVLGHYGIIGGIRQFASQFSQRTGIAVEVNGAESAPRLAAPVELALFRITQETLANVAKHSSATKVVVGLEEKDDTFRLTIADNGRGFDPDKTALSMAGHTWGLMSLTERAIAVGGICHIESQPGQGTRVLVEVSRC